jgi:hypothetical protein
MEADWKEILPVLGTREARQMSAESLATKDLATEEIFLNLDKPAAIAIGIMLEDMAVFCATHFCLMEPAV